MKLYFHDDKPGDPRNPHDSGTSLPLSYLATMGIVHYLFPPSDPSSVEALENIAETRNYGNHDEITISPSAMGPAYTGGINAFYEEHMHEDEEIRYILQGAGYFDVRDMDDRWVRMRAEEGDLVILPAGIYHRFTVDEGDYVHAIRLFQSQPKWDALYRGTETDDMEVRKAYLRARACGFSDDGAAYSSEELESVECAQS